LEACSIAETKVEESEAKNTVHSIAHTTSIVVPISSTYNNTRKRLLMEQNQRSR
jgi:hypothetical protein